MEKLELLKNTDKLALPEAQVHQEFGKQDHEKEQEWQPNSADANMGHRQWEATVAVEEAELLTTGLARYQHSPIVKDSQFLQCFLYLHLSTEADSLAKPEKLHFAASQGYSMEDKSSVIADCVEPS